MPSLTLVAGERLARLEASGQSALSFANLTTLRHFSVSSAMNCPNSAGEPGNTGKFKSANRAFILGSARVALISLFSLPTIAAGVFFGAAMPAQKLASTPGTYSPMLGCREAIPSGWHLQSPALAADRL